MTQVMFGRHDGSRAGLAAKPVIDLMAAVPELSAVGPHEDAPAGLGLWSTSGRNDGRP